MQIAFQHASATVIVEQLATGVTDIAVLAVDAGGAKLPNQIAQQTLAEEPLCLLTARGDELSVRGGGDPSELMVDDLRGRPVIMPVRGTALRALLDGAFARAGFSPLPRFETNEPAMIRELVSARLGVSIVPRSWLADHGPAVTSVEFAEPLPAYRIALLSTTQSRIPARDRLVEHLLIALGARGIRA